jgi:hypothetical protein
MKSAFGEKKRPGLRRRRRITWIGAALVAAVLVLGCSNPASNNSNNTTAYETYLYMTEGNNNYVYTYSPSSHAASSTALLTAPGKYAGEIKFYKGIGYIAMGGGGVDYFDPSATVPSATQITGSGTINAQYFAFYNATQAYVSAAGTNAAGGGTGAVYSFNPSNLGAGLTQVDGANACNYMQEIIVGSDNYIYVAEPIAQQVQRIDPSTDKVVFTITTSSPGTTGLYAGSYKGSAGIFVANVGTAAGITTDGSIDFIPNATSPTSNGLVQVLAPSLTVFPGRLVQLANGNLVAVGYDASWVGHTYLISLTNGAATVSEIKAGTKSFGFLDVAYNSSSGLVYVPTNNGTNNLLYVFDASGTQQAYSPVTVMTNSEYIANVAFYQD